MIFTKVHALPARTNTGNLTELGTFAEAVKGFSLRFIATGVLAINKQDPNDTYFMNYSKGVLREIKEGRIVRENMGHLLVQESKFQDDDGKEAVRILITLRQGDSGEAVDGDVFAETTTQKEIAPKVVSIENFKLSALFA